MIDRTYRDDPYEYMSQDPCDYCQHHNTDKCDEDNCPNCGQCLDMSEVDEK